MPEMGSIASDELARLQERVENLTIDNSCLRMIVNLMNSISAAQGLESVVDAILHNILEVVGGAAIHLYYLIDADVRYADSRGNHQGCCQIDDELVKSVFERREPVEFAPDERDSRLQTWEVPGAYTGVYPLVAGTEMVGVLKLESLHGDMRKICSGMPTIATHVASVLRKEILCHVRHRQAYDQLRELNEELQLRVAERELAEEELRQAMGALEERVRERTADLHDANDRLQLELVEHELAQEELRRYSEELHDLYNLAPCGYHSLDRDGTFIRVNDTELQWLGYTRDEMMGRKFSDFVTQRSALLFRDNFPAFLAQGWARDLEYEMVRKDGSILPVLLCATAVFDESGNFVMSRGTIHDVTEQVRLTDQLKMQQIHQEELIQQRTTELLERGRELQNNQRALMNVVDDLNEKTEELEQANTKLLELDKLKSMFIASMSHELRTPLNSIIGFSSILRDEWIGPVNGEQRENLDIILRSGKHLLSLINDVIDVSKLEAGKMEVSVSDFDLFDVMQEGISYVAKDIREKGLEQRIEALHLTMSTDRQRLLQCMLNLLSNALKFTDKGSISLGAKLMVPSGNIPEEAIVEISVADTGVGIREDDLPKMFQPFVRLALPLQATVPGTGLGLYLTRKLAVELLKGDILVTSDYGSGSRFVIRIPVRLS